MPKKENNGLNSQQELFERYKGLAEELRFVKQLQWKNIYYVFLLFSANIGLFKLVNIIWVKNLIAIVTAILTSGFQIRHYYAIEKYRARQKAIDAKLDNKLKDKIDKYADDNYKNQLKPIWFYRMFKRFKNLESAIYLIIFIVVIFLLGGIALIINSFPK